jgi:hypothetical protein
MFFIYKVYLYSTPIDPQTHQHLYSTETLYFREVILIKWYVKSKVEEVVFTVTER